MGGKLDGSAGKRLGNSRMTEAEEYCEEWAAITVYDGSLTKFAEKRQAKYETKEKSAGNCE